MLAIKLILVIYLNQAFGAYIPFKGIDDVFNTNSRENYVSSEIIQKPKTNKANLPAQTQQTTQQTTIQSILKTTMHSTLQSTQSLLPTQSEKNTHFSLNDFSKKFPWLDDIIKRLIEFFTRFIIWLIARYIFKSKLTFLETVV